MPIPVVTSFYAGLAALMLFVLSLRVIRQRRKARVSLGYGSDATLERRIRAQANFTEYVPLALVLMLILESMALSPLALHFLGAGLLVGRSVHAWALEAASGTGRIVGMALTFAVLISEGLMTLRFGIGGPV
jgi:uncharacterized protein